jgi:endonuclease/exonuclease/phosphatase family metal-dependent hydrolase
MKKAFFLTGVCCWLCTLLSSLGPVVGATDLRIVSWNTANGPNRASDEVAFRTVIHAITEAKRFDVLVVQETDIRSGADLLDIVNDENGGGYQIQVSDSDRGGDRTGFIYDPTAVSLVEWFELSEDVTHNILRGQFQPVGSGKDAQFYVYAVHLKSGAGKAEATTRGFEAELIRADANSLGEGASVIFVGDFNMLGSSEAAWSAMTAGGSAQGFDLADSPGYWRDNSAFRDVHTQDPRGNMDDRFDIFFATGELFDGAGIDYVDESARVFGNNGTHCLGCMISTGDAAWPGVLEALSVASDHLPVVADFRIHGPVGPPLEAGDADQDFRFDFGDIFQVMLARGKYETGNAATWGDGDWDGAPGGSQGNPPVGDGVFHFDDVFAALATGNYETGSYVSGGLVPTAVPEPDSSLVATGVFLVTVASCRIRRSPAGRRPSIPYGGA